MPSVFVVFAVCFTLVSSIDRPEMDTLQFEAAFQGKYDLIHHPHTWVLEDNGHFHYKGVLAVFYSTYGEHS